MLFKISQLPLLKRYSSVAKILRDFPSSVVLVGRDYGESYHNIVLQQHILGIRPQVYYRPPYSKYSIGLAVPKDDLQGIADRYYIHNNIYIQNAIKIWKLHTTQK